MTIAFASHSGISVRSLLLRWCALLGLLLLNACGSASDTLTWDWSYARPEQGAGGKGGAGETLASGTFTTEKTPDADGFYLIVAVTGQRLGVPIIALHPTGTAIPDNEPYALDNRVRDAHPDGQLTKAGFGFAMQNGTYENAFHANFRSPPVYMAFLSKPPFGRTPPNTEEIDIVFQARKR